MGLKLEAEIGLNSTIFEKGMDRVKESVLGTVKAYALGAIGVYSLERAFEATIETAEELNNQSKRLGVTVEQLQVMRKAASDAGVEMETLASSMDKLNIFRAKALGSGSEGSLARNQAAQLGITPAMLKNMDAQAMLFGPIAEKIRSVNPQQIAAPLSEVLGKGFSQVIPVITTDMKELHEKMERLGMIMSAETARDLGQLNEAAHSVQNIFVNALAPALVAFVEMILGVLTSGGLLSSAFEGLFFKINQWTTKLPDFKDSAGGVHPNTERVYAATQLQDFIHESIGKMKEYLPKAGVAQQNEAAFNAVMNQIKKPIGTQRTEYAVGETSRVFDPHIFDDFKGSNLNDLNKYINTILQPKADADQAAGKKSEDVISGIRAVLEGLKKPVDAIKQPEFQAAATNEAKMRIPEDSLIKVGNFLGSSKSVINGAQNRLEAHAASTATNTGKAVKLLTNILDRLIIPSSGDKTHWPPP